MVGELHITAVIPALNEAHCIGLVITQLKQLQDKNGPLIDEIVVCDNGSTDNTAQIARQSGATTIHQEKRGYGSACQTALSVIRQTDLVLFLNADRSEKISEAPKLLEQINNGADLVIGNRIASLREPGAMLLQQRLGNRLASTMVRWFWHCSCNDLGPFRVIRYNVLKSLAMRDQDYGWTIEMQIKALRHGFKVVEVPVSSLKGLTPSRISGTVKGTVNAAVKIIGTIVYYGLLDKFNQCSRRFYFGWGGRDL